MGLWLQYSNCTKNPVEPIKVLRSSAETQLAPRRNQNQGLGKRYWFASDAPDEEEREEDEETRFDDDAGGRSRRLGFFFGRRAEIWALRDLFCRIQPGEHVAVIGGNGSGKSTLIRVLSRTLPPSEGTIEGAGSVVPFRANGRADQHGAHRLRQSQIIVRLLGLPLRRLEERLPEIIDFSELGALAHERVSRYSSKSFLRLSMAMALCMDADIYLIDDGLSVADPIYHAKVKAKFAEILGRNRTLIFASNDLHELRLYCRRALWLEGGKLVADGEMGEMVERYLTHRREPSGRQPTGGPTELKSEPNDTESHAADASQSVASSILTGES